MKSVAFLDANNIVLEVCVFEEEDPALLEQIKNHLSAHDYKSCEVYGQTSKGHEFYNGKFYVEKPFPSWIRNEELGKWEAPIAMPEDISIAYEWDEETTSWKAIVV